MPFYNLSARQVIADQRLGMRVDRAAATLPQTAAGALFNVIGGAVAIIAIVGEVTVIMGATANNTKLTGNPTVGTAVDLCAVLATENDEVGCLYGITGTIADALVGEDAGAAPMQANPLAVNIGTIDLDCAANNTGEVKWSIFYVPIEDGAYIEAA